MRHLVALATLGLACGLTALPSAALACTPPSGYTVPTNLQLAEAANAIVLGEVVSGGQGTVLDPGAATITVHPLSALKGLLPGHDIVLSGMTIAQPDDEAANALSDPLAFGDPHPQALTGACIRRVFPLGAKALFFLRRENGEWVPAGGPFGRWAADVAGPDAPWVELASLYAQAAMLPPEQGRALLQERYTALIAEPDDPQAVAMAADLERSLAAPAQAPVVVSLPVVPSDEAAPQAERRQPEDVPAVAAEGEGQVAAPSPDEASAPPDDLARVEAAIDAFGQAD
jgi:hypothetical protein